MIGNWNFSSAPLTQITFLTYELKFLILHQDGKILIYDHNTENSWEFRRYEKPGNYKGIVTDNDEFLYLVGYKDQIEFWNLQQKVRVDVFTRDSLDDDRSDFTIFHQDLHGQQILGFSDSAMIYWNMDEQESVEIFRKTYFPFQFQIQRIFPLKESLIFLFTNNQEILLFDFQQRKIVAKVESNSMDPCCMIQG